MEDISETLHARSLKVSVPLETPEIDDIVLVEEQILIGLPVEMKEFMLEVGDVIYGTLEPVTVMDPQSHTYLPEVASTAWSLGLPRHLIPVCQSGEKYYCIESDGEISLWENDESSEEIWDSIWHWAEDVWLNS